MQGIHVSLFFSHFVCEKQHFLLHFNVSARNVMSLLVHFKVFYLAELSVRNRCLHFCLWKCSKISRCGSTWKPPSPEFLVCSVTILIARRLVAVHFPSGAWGWGRIPMSSRRGRGSAPHQVSAPHGGAAARVGKLMLSWYVLNINE